MAGNVEFVDALNGTLTDPAARAGAMPQNLRDAGEVYSEAEADTLLAAKLNITDLDAELASKPLATSGISSNVAISAANGVVRSTPFAINACDYGVRTTNSRAENSARLQEVSDILYAQPYGGRIILPVGKYDFDPAAQVQFPKTSGKCVELVGEGWGTEIDVGTSATDAAFYIGDPVTSAGTTGFAARNVLFRGGSTSTGRAFEMEWANGAKFDNCNFSLMKNAILMTSCYGVEVVGNQFENVGGANIYSSTTCHHLVIDRTNAYNAGDAGSAQFLQIDAGHTDNLVIRDSDFEGCRQIVRADDGLSSFIFNGNYVEYCDVDPFDFGTGAFGVAMDSNWLALGLAFTFHDWNGGSFRNNKLYNQNVAFSGDCTDIHVADTRVTGTSVLTTSSLMHTISAFLNGATANATYPPKYSKSDGILQLHGQVDNCPGGGAPVFALPSGYRPMQTGAWPAVKSDNTTFRAVVVDATNGNVVPSSAAAEAIRIDGVMFRTSN